MVVQTSWFVLHKLLPFLKVSQNTHPDTDGNQSQFAMGVTKVGALNNRFQVYKNPYMTSGDVLIGFRGTNFLETGAVYAPYIPLIQTPLVYDPVNFTPRRGVMTRYAKKMVRPEFYGKSLLLVQKIYNSVKDNTKFKRGSFEPLFYFITITISDVYL